MSKRIRTADDSDLVNVLRQRQKHDPIQTQRQGQQTFALMMRAAAHNQSPSLPTQQQVSTDCFRCPLLPKSSCCFCTFCEYPICQQCIQQCQDCTAMYCTACSVIDYSTDAERVYCLTCLTA